MFRKLCGVGAIFMAMGLGAHADTVSFHNVTHNNAGNAALGESLISLEVNPWNVDLDSATPGNQFGVQFILKNGTPGNPGSTNGQPIVTEILFDDRTPPTMALPITLQESFAGNVDVDFNVFASNEAPNYNFENFSATAGFGADRENQGGVGHGVNRGEQLGLIFRLNVGSTYANVLSALQDGSLRAAIHVQSFPNDGSEKYISGPPTVVPLPPAVLGGLVLLGGLGAARLWGRRAVDTAAN